MAAEKKPVYNANGTHVYVTTPSGDLWECPPDYLPIALRREYQLADAPVDDGVHLDEPAPAKKTAAKKTSGD